MKKKILFLSTVIIGIFSVVMGSSLLANSVEDAQQLVYSDTIEEQYDVEDVEDATITYDEYGRRAIINSTAPDSESREAALAEKEAYAQSAEEELTERGYTVDTASDTIETSNDLVIPDYRMEQSQDYYNEKYDITEKTIAIVNEKLDRSYQIPAFLSIHNEELSDDVLYLYFETDLTDAEAYYMREYMSFYDLCFDYDDSRFPLIQQMLEERATENN